MARPRTTECAQPTLAVTGALVPTLASESARVFNLVVFEWICGTLMPSEQRRAKLVQRMVVDSVGHGGLVGSLARAVALAFGCYRPCRTGRGRALGASPGALMSGTDGRAGKIPEARRTRALVNRRRRA